MLRKQLIKFYFCADKLDIALNGVIMSSALRSREVCGSAELYAQRIRDIIDVKDELQSLWAYIDGEICDFDKSDVSALKFYALRREGLGGLRPEQTRKIKSALIKFTRRVKFIDRYERAVKALREYYCIM